MTGEKDPRDVMQAEHDAGLSEHPAFQAPAEMPAIYRIADEFERELFAWRDLPLRDGAALRACAYALAQKAETLFAPILAEKERRDAADAKRKEFGKWLDELAENPPPPSEALKKLLADYKASGIQSVGIDSPFNACCHREECRSLEARALAAEAALAEIAGQDVTEIALDPDWPRRIASAARASAAHRAAMEAP